MAITYDAPSNIITVTAYTEGTPCNFTDIYNADVAGSWGVVTRQCTDQFCLTCGIVIGDGSTATWFADVSKHILFTSATPKEIVEVKANGHFRLGELVADKRTKNGCCLHSQRTTQTQIRAEGTGGTGKIEMYSTCLSCDASAGLLLIYANGIKVYNCCLSKNVYFNLCANVDYFNITLQNSTTGGFRGSSGAFDKIVVTDSASTYGVVFAGTEGFTVKNLYARNNTRIFYAFSVFTASDGYAVNWDVDNWIFHWDASATKRLYRQYEFDLKLIDGGGTGIDTGKVKIWDKDDSLVTNTTTNASGVLATQTLNYGYYTQTGGNTPTMKTPHETRVYKYGKEMLSFKSNIENKTDWALTMLTDPHITQTTEATVAAYTGITINHTTETITISENHTLDEIYDYCQYDIIAATKQLDQTMHTADGVNFVSEYSFVVNTGITVTATDQKLSTVSGETYTLTGTAQFTGIIATTTTTRIPVKLTNIVDGSRYWVGKESDGSKIFDGTQSGSGTVTGYYEHTANINIDIRVRKSSASVKYQPWVGEGTLIADAFSLRIRQIQDSIIT